MTTAETRMMMIFNEWAARYAANPDEFSEILGEDGKPVDDYGEKCMRYFAKIAAEMDEAGQIPPCWGRIRPASPQLITSGRNFRWAYALLVELAKVCLDKANAEAQPGAWPAQQEWDDLGSTSKSTFLREAREMASIPHDEFLEVIRSGGYDLVDLFDSSNTEP